MGENQTEFHVVGRSLRGLELQGEVTATQVRGAGAAACQAAEGRPGRDFVTGGWAQRCGERCLHRLLRPASNRPRNPGADRTPGAPLRSVQSIPRITYRLRVPGGATSGLAVLRLKNP